MSSTNTLAEYDYIVFDSRGFRKVINGIEYPLTDAESEEYRREHKDTDCAECLFVTDHETLLTFNIEKEQKGTVGEEPVFIGNYTMPKWKGHLPFYLFRCICCGEAVVDYPHGYNNRLNCMKCKGRDVARAPNL